MKSEQLTATRHVIQDIAVIEIFNPDDRTWEYYVSRKNNADLEFYIGVKEKDRLEAATIRRLWIDGFFDTAKEV